MGDQQWTAKDNDDPATDAPENVWRFPEASAGSGVPLPSCAFFQSAEANSVTKACQTTVISRTGPEQEICKASLAAAMTSILLGTESYQKAMGKTLRTWDAFGDE